MKKMLVIIVILAMILVSMIIYKNIAINKNKSVRVHCKKKVRKKYGINGKVRCIYQLQSCRG